MKTIANYVFPQPSRREGAMASLGYLAAMYVLAAAFIVLLVKHLF